jgi:hypothetical protein
MGGREGVEGLGEKWREREGGERLSPNQFKIFCARVARIHKLETLEKAIHRRKLISRLLPIVSLGFSANNVERKINERAAPRDYLYMSLSAVVQRVCVEHAVLNQSPRGRDATNVQ